VTLVLALIPVATGTAAAQTVSISPVSISPVSVSSVSTSPLPAGSSELISVRTANAMATAGTLTAWDEDPQGIWHIAFGPMPAEVGANGIGQAAEGSTTTPAGTYPLDQAFGREPNPGTAMPYFTTDELDWWDENPASPTYDLHVRQRESPGGDSENLYASGRVYDYAVNIGYNPGRVPGAGSAFFLHVSEGVPTAGCVAIDRAALARILRWLSPARAPMISIQVGPAWNPPAPPTVAPATSRAEPADFGRVTLWLPALEVW